LIARSSSPSLSPLGSRGARRSSEHADFIDILQRVVTRGVVFEVEEDTDASATDRGASGWFHIVITGVEVFRIEAGALWRYLVDDEEKSEA
jgi:hypothetical protein